MAEGNFKILPCSIQGMHAVFAASRHSFPRHTHDRFGIGIILRGAQASLSGRGTVEAGPGDVITVNPGEVHDGRAIGETGRAWHMLYLDPALVTAMTRDICDNASADFEFHEPVMSNALCRDVLATLLDSAVRPRERGADEEALLVLLAQVAGVTETRGIGNGRLACARERLDDDPAGPANLTDLAEESGLSRFQFLRAFARETGLTPHAYGLQRRIDLAVRLMAKGMPLASVAVDAGFSDQSHFTRHFVRRYGISPGAYQQVVAARLQ